VSSAVLRIEHACGLLTAVSQQPDHVSATFLPVALYQSDKFSETREKMFGWG